MKKRSLSELLFGELKNGRLKPFVDMVKNDDLLCMEFRGSNVEIYYRGGLLYKIAYNENNNEFDITPCISYDKNNQIDVNLVDECKKVDEVKISKLCKQKQEFKGIMDDYLCKNHRLEVEYQQNIERENNDIMQSTDYYIVDLEYKESSKDQKRFDMVAFQWKSNGASRQNPKDLKLAIIEVKFGKDALDNEAGLEKHIKDFNSFISDDVKLKEFVEDMKNVFEQKVKLGLVNAWNEKYDLNNFSISYEKPEMLLVLANLDPDSKKFNNLISQLDEKEIENVFVAKASMMGYGLYRFKNKEDTFIKLKDMIE